MKTIRMSSIMALGALAIGPLVTASASAAIVISDFSTVPAAGHPAGAGVAGTWYSITSDAFATPSLSSLNSSPAMKVGDGGFTNGVYAIYQGVVPTTGTYTVSVDMDVTEGAGTAANALRAYQVGVKVNGVHRAVNPSDLAAVTGPGSAVGNFTGLTTGDDNGLPIQTVTTSQFSATAGDSLLIAFSTDVTSGNFDLNSATWTTATFMTVDNLMLNFIPEPSTFGLAVLSLVGVGATVRRRKF